MNSLKTYTVSIFILLSIFSVFITSCTEEESENTDEKKRYTGDAQIEFNRTEYDFGTLSEGEVVECVFRYTNTGEGPLQILSVEADCGCTVPEYSSEKILPGEEGKIKVVFNSSGFRNNIYKTIDVETNAKQSYIELLLTAFIENNNYLN